jgi:hypothetical protein
MSTPLGIVSHGLINRGGKASLHIASFGLLRTVIEQQSSGGAINRRRVYQQGYIPNKIKEIQAKELEDTLLMRRNEQIIIAMVV